MTERKKMDSYKLHNIDIFLNEKNADYRIEYNSQYVSIEVKYKCEIHTERTFEMFDTIHEATDFVIQNEKVCTVMNVLNDFTREMENYCYYGSNPGISFDDYENLANTLIQKFGEK